MKNLLWAYRILWGFCLLAILIFLVAKGGAVLGKWFIDLYPPYSGYSFLASVFILGTWALLAEAKNKRGLRESLPEISEDADANGTSEQLAELYGVTLAKGDTEFFLPFQNPEHAIWCADNEIDFIVGLMGSMHHEHYVYMEEAREEIEAIRTEKNVHMIFFDEQGVEHWNDLYATQDLDAEISARFYPAPSYQPWWKRCLRIIFLVAPPFTPEVLRVEIYSYRGTYDRTVFKNE